MSITWLFAGIICKPLQKYCSENIFKKKPSVLGKSAFSYATWWLLVITAGGFRSQDLFLIFLGHDCASAELLLLDDMKNEGSEINLHNCCLIAEAGGDKAPAAPAGKHLHGISSEPCKRCWKGWGSFLSHADSIHLQSSEKLIFTERRHIFFDAHAFLPPHFQARKVKKKTPPLPSHPHNKERLR